MSVATYDSPSAPGISADHKRALEWIDAGPKRLLIGGQWVEAVSGKVFETLNPATEERLTLIAEADSADVDAAVAAARRALEAPSWSKISPSGITRSLLKIADAVEQHAEELAILETLDNGAPLSSTKGRASQVAEIFRYYAGWPTKIYGTTNPTDGSRFIYMVREPMGVCALINAWNVPLVMAAMKIAPARPGGRGSRRGSRPPRRGRIRCRYPSAPRRLRP